MPAEQSKAVARRYFEEFHTGRRDEILEEIVAPALLEPTRAATARVRSAFPDYRMIILDQVAEDEKVATVWRLEGTHQGSWESPMGSVAPTGKSIAYTGTTTLRITDGKIAEVIGTNWDHLGILQQMAALPASASRSGA